MGLVGFVSRLLEVTIARIRDGHVSSVSIVTDVDARHAGCRSMLRRHALCVGDHLWVKV